MRKLEKSNDIRRQEEFDLDYGLEQKAHYLCQRNGLLRPRATRYSDPFKFLEDNKLYMDKFKYYYSQLKEGKMQVI